MTVATTGWVERDGLLRSPALTALGLVAGFSTRALGSMAGGVYPLQEQERNRESLARALGVDRGVGGEERGCRAGAAAVGRRSGRAWELASGAATAVPKTMIRAWGGRLRTCSSRRMPGALVRALGV